ncbi:MAG: 50S ribosomal protein L4 [Acidimicrobiia bacterium]|nr:50S ribosomal protein L4 [Acidimicrobiia bacterium]
MMASVDIRTRSGDAKGSVELDDALFGIEPNQDVLHQVVTAQLAARRRGTHSTLTRAEVRGGGAKPWRQKGTGRARQGSTRSPHWAGGGVAMGPKPRDYSQKTPKKMIELALRSALSDRAAEGKVAVVDAWDFAAPKTREAKAAIGALGLTGKVLVVLEHDDVTAAKSFRNLPDVQPIRAAQLNAYDILRNDWVVFTRATLPSAGQAPAPAPAPASAPAPATTEAPAPAAEPAAQAPAAASEPAPPEEQA